MFNACILQDFPCVAMVGLGNNDAGVCGAEYWDTCKENVRAAVSGKKHCFAWMVDFIGESCICVCVFIQSPLEWVARQCGGDNVFCTHGASSKASGTSVTI